MGFKTILKKTGLILVVGAAAAIICSDPTYLNRDQQKLPDPGSPPPVDIGYFPAPGSSPHLLDDSIYDKLQDQVHTWPADATRVQLKEYGRYVYLDTRGTGFWSPEGTSVKGYYRVLTPEEAAPFYKAIGVDPPEEETIKLEDIF